MTFRFWLESAVKPDPLCCGYDWVVVAGVVTLMLLLAGGRPT